jgi:hypothetical protein
VVQPALLFSQSTLCLGESQEAAGARQIAGAIIVNGTLPELHRKSVVVIGHDHAMIGVMTRREQGERAVFSNNVAPLIREGGVSVLGLVVGGDRPRPEKGGGLPGGILWR